MTNANSHFYKTTRINRGKLKSYTFRGWYLEPPPATEQETMGRALQICPPWSLLLLSLAWDDCSGGGGRYMACQWWLSCNFNMEIICIQKVVSMLPHISLFNFLPYHPSILRLLVAWEVASQRVDRFFGLSRWLLRKPQIKFKSK